MIKLTKKGKENLLFQLAELKAKRKEILDAGLDTAIDIYLPTMEDICSDIEKFEDADGDYYNVWNATEHYGQLICMHRGTDFN